MNVRTVFTAYKNGCYQLLGLLMVGLGIIGIALPVMPTTIFFILALGCFTRSSPALSAWLLNHPRYGESLRYWQLYKVVPLRAKFLAGLGMAVGYFFLLQSAAPIWVMYLIAVIEVCVLGYLINRPSKPNHPTLIQLNISTRLQLMLLASLFTSQLAIIAYLAIQY
ncbi:DUF454 domain-containing protein [Pseudoalteromonas lipolytica]|uniref:DUF454 domain-containing protein n=1 Tax=Pseudoalteromonas lipolytica TaxID=570156 RepID=A0AAD0S209_9GAMM|nr:DUF454 domain-containing protein [Pseudoalteromonas donghaensis]